ncbi:MAG TPA: aldehyde dehydrogenase family protein [Methanocella sp.]|nr:aldehyde dehydrogenase family protein [Methanocella sp.]
MEMFIDGKATVSGTGSRFNVINPATGEVIDTAPAGDADDVRKAVESATHAFSRWSSMTARDRGKILFKAAQIARAHTADLATLLTTEQGKPFKEARDEVQGFANVLEYYAGISAGMRMGLVPIAHERYGAVIRKPLGVCGAIIPWNVPVILMSWKVGPALVSGNTMVLKPASSAPLTCLKLAGIMKEAGLPDGVLNIVTGRGDVVGEEIARNPGIQKVSFTGKTSTGKRILGLASEGLKRVTLEMGGSDPMIVCDDANLKAAVEGAVRGRFYNCGQTCTAVKRLFVFESVADEYLRGLIAKIAALKVGNGMAEGVDLGPLNNRKQLQRIVSAIDMVRAKGEGKIIIGGEAPQGEPYECGFFYLPTLVTDVAKDSILMREEIFGPVLPLTVVKDLDDAIDQANDTVYGLGSSIWTRSIERATIACERLQSGITWVNQHTKVPPDLPFGGIKDSGLGRENGLEAVDQYTEVKSVLINP